MKSNTFLLALILFLAVGGKPVSAACSNTSLGNGFTCVQSRASAGIISGAGSLAFLSNVTAGNAIVVGYEYSHRPDTITCSDGVNTYTDLASLDNNQNGASLGLSYAVNIASGATTVTCTPSSSNHAIIIAEISGVATASAGDGSNKGDQATTSAPTSGNITTTNAVDLILGFDFSGDGTGAVAAGSGFTLLQVVNVGGNPYIGMEAKSVASTGTYAAVFSTQSSAAGTMAVALKASGGGTPNRKGIVF